MPTTSTRFWLVLPLLLLTVSTGRAQDEPPSSTRAAELAATRDRKATELTPPGRSSLERGLSWYDNQYVLAKVFGGWNGVHMASGDFPAGAGTTFGVRVTRALTRPSSPDQNPGLSLGAVAAHSTRGYSRLGTSLHVRPHAGAVAINLRGERYTFAQEDFFGIGSNSRVDDRTNYQFEATEAAADVLWSPAQRIELSGGMAYVAPNVASGTDPRFPSTDEVFDPHSLPGYAAQPDYLRSDAGLAFDWRDNASHPHAGGRYSVQVSNFADRDLDDYSFRRMSVNLQQYVPLPSRYRLLALHAAAVLTDASNGQDVPFYYQPTLGGSQSLRGFREFRFRDRNSLSMTAEYRWEAWWALDGAVFVDAGTVAPTLGDLRLKDLDISYGIGFRIHSNRAFVARLDLARGREGFIPLLRFDHVF